MFAFIQAWSGQSGRGLVPHLASAAAPAFAVDASVAPWAVEALAEAAALAAPEALAAGFTASVVAPASAPVAALVAPLGAALGASDAEGAVVVVDADVALSVVGSVLVHAKRAAAETMLKRRGKRSMAVSLAERRGTLRGWNAPSWS
jgi:hypothetical protein